MPVKKIRAIRSTFWQTVVIILMTTPPSNTSQKYFTCYFFNRCIGCILFTKQILIFKGDRQKINRAYNCIPEDSCWDEDPSNCPVWAKAGACKNPDWVPKTACPKKCGRGSNSVPSLPLGRLGRCWGARA